MLRKNILAKRHSAKRRAVRTRATIHGTAEKPRLSVFRSDKHISAQIINDDLGRTIVAASDMKMAKSEKPMARAASVGAELAKAAVAAGVTTVVFDRGSYLYHGRIAALAQACRDNGLHF